VSFKAQFEPMASYNRWMSAKLHEASSLLSTTACLRLFFFGSIFGTLNHLLVVDIIWLKRFAEPPAAFTSLDRVRPMQHRSSLAKPLRADSTPTARNALCHYGRRRVARRRGRLRPVTPLRCHRHP
jgi:uncharacterized damage-inducible protein DinB